LKPLAAPSPWLLRHLTALAEAAERGPILDLACGRGRHALPLAERGLPVVALDRDAGLLAELRARARALPLRCLRADLETGSGIPVRPGSCGAILVFRFLFRPLAPAIVQALAPGGLLLYETFLRAEGEATGGPRNPAFRLAPGELRALFPELREIASEEGVSGARLAARRAG
jgi:SAM-dependent methyltransferase